MLYGEYLCDKYHKYAHLIALVFLNLSITVNTIAIPAITVTIKSVSTAPTIVATTELSEAVDVVSCDL